MAKDSKLASTIGDNLKRIRLQRGLTQKAVADAASMDQAQVSNYERGVEQPQAGTLRSLARALDVTVEQLTLTEIDVPLTGLAFQDNPRRIRVEDIVLEGVYVLFESEGAPLEFSIRYLHQRLDESRDLAAHYTHLRELARRRAQEAGVPYYAGPNTRLLRVTEENNRQLAGGAEKKGLVLEVGPVSWFEYSVLNTFLDHPLPGERWTIRSRFCDAQRLFGNGPDLRWCALSNLFTTLLVPITTDGYGLVQRRSKTGVSVFPGRLTSGVSENIHRYRDEADRANLWCRLNDPRTPSRTVVDEHYRPKGVPSPFLAALWGVNEELSPALYERLSETPARFRFLKIVMDLEVFAPHIIGVIELDSCRDEIMRTIEEWPGKDLRSESLGIECLALDLRGEQTANFVSNQRRWTPSGLAAFLTAIRFWETRHQHSEFAELA